MIKSDYARNSHAWRASFEQYDHGRASRRARCHLDVPVRRSLRGARAAARRCSRERTATSAGSSCSAARPARARAGSCASSPPRPPATARSSSTAPADAVVRTPYGPFVEALEPAGPRARRRRAARSRGLGAGELARLLPDLAARTGRFQPRATPTPTPSVTACTPRSPTCWPASRGAVSCCSCSRTRTGPMPPRCFCCVISPARRRAAAGARHLPRHGVGRARAAVRDARRPAPLRRRAAAAARALARRGGRVRAPRGRHRARRPRARHRTRSPTATRSCSASCGAR